MKTTNNVSLGIIEVNKTNLSTKNSTEETLEVKTEKKSDSSEKLVEIQNDLIVNKSSSLQLSSK